MEVKGDWKIKSICERSQRLTPRSHSVAKIKIIKMFTMTKHVRLKLLLVLLITSWVNHQVLVLETVKSRSISTSHKSPVRLSSTPKHRLWFFALIVCWTAQLIILSGDIELNPGPNQTLFSIGDTVYVYWGDPKKLFEAKVVDRHSGAETKYNIHYKQWKKRYDEWVNASQVVSQTEGAALLISNPELLPTAKNRGGSIISDPGVAAVVSAMASSHSAAATPATVQTDVTENIPAAAGAVLKPAAGSEITAAAAAGGEAAEPTPRVGDGGGGGGDEGDGGGRDDDGDGRVAADDVCEKHSNTTTQDKVRCCDKCDALQTAVENLSSRVDDLVELIDAKCIGIKTEVSLLRHDLDLLKANRNPSIPPHVSSSEQRSSGGRATLGGNSARGGRGSEQRNVSGGGLGRANVENSRRGDRTAASSIANRNTGGERNPSRHCVLSDSILRDTGNLFSLPGVCVYPRGGGKLYQMRQRLATLDPKETASITMHIGGNDLNLEPEKLLSSFLSLFQFCKHRFPGIPIILSAPLMRSSVDEVYLFHLNCELRNLCVQCDVAFIDTNFFISPHDLYDGVHLCVAAKRSVVSELNSFISELTKNQ